MKRVEMISPVLCRVIDILSFTCFLFSFFRLTTISSDRPMDNGKPKALTVTLCHWKMGTVCIDLPFPLSPSSFLLKTEKNFYKTVAHPATCEEMLLRLYVEAVIILYRLGMWVRDTDPHDFTLRQNYRFTLTHLHYFLLRDM